MQIRVLFFGVLKDIAQKSDDLLTLSDGATVAELLRHYQARIPQLENHRRSLAVSVNQEYAGMETPLKQGDEVALLPPVSGGTPRCSIVSQKIDSQGVIDNLRQPQDGAVAVFEGVVRDNSRGRRTLYLDYEAYEAMALKQLENLAEQALTQFKIRDVAVAHRLGRLQIGETSVLIAVASAHRAAAFEACRWLIDSLKRTVPIWKKEYFEDGAVWADGEPFPAEVTRPAGTHSTVSASNLDSH